MILSTRIFKATNSTSRTKPSVHPQRTLKQLVTFGGDEMSFLVGRKTLRCILYLASARSSLKQSNLSGIVSRAMLKPGILQQKI